MTTGTKQQKLVIALSGASGVGLGVRMIEAIPKEIELFVVLSKSAKLVSLKEMDRNLESTIDAMKHGRKLDVFDEDAIESSIASGSFGIDKMAIIPTSMDMLAKIACGICDSLISRCASVMIKENRKLLLSPRELPFSAIALENMLKLSRLGVIIAPPVMGYYAKTFDLNSMENFIIGKWLDVLEITNELYPRWGF